MTRKDFELIAEAVRLAHADANYRDKPQLRAGISHTARWLAAGLAGTNPCFDRARFLKACGVEE